jgi:hypothetical protein
MEGDDKAFHWSFVIAVWTISNIPLGILAWWIGGLFGWQRSGVIVLFGGMMLLSTLALVAILIVASQWGITLAVREHHRTVRGRDYLESKLKYRELELKEMQIRYQGQMQEHATLQIGEMVQPNYVPSLAVPENESKTRILQYLQNLYVESLNRDGRICCTVPWGTKSKEWTDDDKKEALRLFRLANQAVSTWVVRYDKGKHAWFVNVERYPDGFALVRAFAGVI